MSDTTTFPSSILVKDLDAKHPEYKAHLQTWCDLDILAQGGDAVKKHCDRLLAKRPSEPSEVYVQRTRMVRYQNIIGSVLRWYRAAQFCEDPNILRSQGGKTVEEDDQYANFLKNCDGGNVTLVDFFRRVYDSLLLHKRCAVLEDLPPSQADAPKPASKADQLNSGALDPRLVLYTPDQIINWQADAAGNLQWIKFYTCSTEQDAFKESATIYDRWYYFNRNNFATYEFQHPADKQRDDSKDKATLVDAGPHAMADQDRVPVRWLEFADWLSGSAYLDLLAHFNTQNALDWGLYQACLPMLWVKGSGLEEPKRTEVGYINLGTDGEIGYVEPSGTSFKIAAEEVASIREEIYRVMHLQAQGRTSSATPASQSGYSKEMDMAPAVDVLNGHGDFLRAAIRDLLADVALIRGDKNSTWDVRGFQHEETDTLEELETGQLARDSQLDSDTLDKEIQKKMARSILPDALPELVGKIDAEIDAAPTKSEKEAQMQADQMTKLKGSVGGALKASFIDNA